jgi:glyoxylase-like metal-dependent hydrolase (beta-lactamase superfamily II)
MKIISHGCAKVRQANVIVCAQVYLYEIKPRELLLVDCAYANDLIEYTDRAKLDFDLIKLNGSVGEFLKGIKYDSIKVLLTHFHPDHIGELNGLKNCKAVYCNLPAFNKYMSMNEVEQREYMFLGEIFKQSPHSYLNALSNPVYGTLLNNYFDNVYDVFGNMEVLAVNLPGHVNDQLGYYFPKTNVFYIGDAIFTIEDIYNGELHPFMKSAAKNIQLANTTLNKLIEIDKVEEIRIVPTHYKK